MGNCCSSANGSPPSAKAEAPKGSAPPSSTAAPATSSTTATAAETSTPELLSESYVRDKLGQGLLLSTVAPEKKGALLEQLTALNKEYPGGLEAYVSNAKSLLESSKKGINPFDGFTPSVPLGERLEMNSDEFAKSEQQGMDEIGGTGFVLVAGGLGERLGYNGIKVALPAEILTGKCFLQNYIEHILALQERANKKRKENGLENVELPLAIMTSDDTHAATEALLQEHSNFGMNESQITLLKQEKVPSLIDNDANFSLDPSSGLVETKPHGHGDVHSLIHMKGVLKAWKEKGIKWIVFFQDTNAQVFRGVIAALGVSASRDFHVNSLTVPRRPGEAVGAICQLNKQAGPETDGKDNKEVNLTINVEYNQLDPLLRATVSPQGDVADESGFSPYPGNINVLIFKLEPYAKILDQTGGGIPEFVNPKYADEEKTKFKKPTRLECMMQDYPKLLLDEADSKVGFTQLDRLLCFSAVKNNSTDAVDKYKSTGFPESASSGESDLYKLNRLLLKSVGVQVNTDIQDKLEFLGLPFEKGAKVVLAPSFGTTIEEIKSRFPNPEKIVLSDTSCLVLEGDVTILDLNLDGYLRITAASGSQLTVKNLTVKNEGIDFVPIDVNNKHVEEVLRIRGYNKDVKQTRVIENAEPGEMVVDGATGDEEGGSEGDGDSTVEVEVSET